MRAQLLILSRRAAALLLAILLSGCGLGDADEEPEPEVPDWATTSAASSAATEPQLTLRLRPGDRFPLRKVIEKEVVQHVDASAPQVHRLRIELTLGMTVESVVDGKTKFNVRYERVKYTHHTPDGIVEYDSTAPPPQTALTLRAWQAMVGDGFSFQVGRDNQIESVDGFQQFLQRCLATIPAEKQEEVMLSIESSSGENGVSDFVDNAIGLLPPSAQIATGEMWRRARHIGRPVPMHLDNLFTLKELTADRAVVQIEGTITPSTTLMDTQGQQSQRLRMVVREGTTWGSCTIFRDTGLPQHSRVEHDILMTVHTSQGRSFDQRVRGSTTIESFPPASRTAPTIIGLPDSATRTAVAPGLGSIR
jgi:hypothetical protein